MRKIPEVSMPLDPNDAYNEEIPFNLKAPVSIPVQTSVDVPGLQPHDEKRLGVELRSGVLGRKIVEFRNKGLHTVFQPMPDKVLIWVGEHRPILGDKIVATSIGIGASAIAAGTVFLIRKARHRKK